MNALHVEYRKQLKSSLGFWASWLPSSRVEVGDIIRLNLKNGITDRVGYLSDFGIVIDEIRETNLGTLQYYSSDSNIVKLTGEASASIAPHTSAIGLRVSFARSGGVVFHATDCTEIEIRDLKRLGEKILNLNESGNWDENSFVVTNTVRSERATIIISNSTNADLVLEADASVVGENIDLATISTGCTIKHNTGIGFQIVTNSTLTPLFLVSGISRSIFRKPVFHSKRVRDSSAKPDQRQNSDSEVEHIVLVRLRIISSWATGVRPLARIVHKKGRTSFNQLI